MSLDVRLAGLWDDLRDSLWLVPVVTLALALGLAATLVAIEPVPDWVPDQVLYGGTPDGAREVLGQLASATFTVVALVFSLTVLALQMAASQFSPRLLRTFLRDRRVQLVMSGMLGSAVYAVAIMQTVRSSKEGVDEFLPHLAVSVSLLLSLVAVALLVFFIHHITQHLRIDVIMNGIRVETLRQLGRLPSHRHILPDQEAPEPPDGATVVTANVGGYLQVVHLDRIATNARRCGVRVRLRPKQGDWVTMGSTLAWVWSDDADAETPVRDEIVGLVHRGIHLGSDRTESDDIAFGLRQLQDIATRALSTGVNDPTIAMLAIGQMSALLCRFAEHPLGSWIAHDHDGSVRAAAPRPGFAALLELAVGPIRRHGASDPEVLTSIVTLLTDVAEHVADDADRSAIVRAQLDRVLVTADLQDAADQERLEGAVVMTRRALDHGSRGPTVTGAS